MKTRKFSLLLGVLLSLTILIVPLPTALAVSFTPQLDQPEAGSSTDQDEAMLAQPTDQIIIKYRTSAALQGAISPTSASELQRLSDAAGVPLTYVREMSGDAHVLGLSTRTPLEEVRAIADRLAALPEVEYAEPDAIMVPMLTPDDKYYRDQWHYHAPGSNGYGINAPAAWDITTGSASIVVADIDTGITNHPEFAGRTVPGYDFISNAYIANDGDGRDSDPSDPGNWNAANECGSGSPAQDSSWHGTHTAGTIGAASNNGTGVAGINWVSKILPVRVLGKCGGLISDIADAMRWSAGLSVPGVPANPNPAKVINMSLGGKGACPASYQDAINAIVASGATVVVSAGNDNADAGGYNPASCNGVITVAATDRDGKRASYSNYGSTVEISAPGGDISVVRTDGVLSTINTGKQGPLDSAYRFYDGTSMAAPHVTGVVSLMYSVNPSLTSAQVLSALQSTVTAFPAGSTCNTSICGSGIVNAGAAVAAVDARSPVPAITGLVPPSATGGGPAFTLTINGTGFVRSSVVRWNGSSRTTTYVSGTQLTAAIAASDIASAGTASITVFNPAPGGGTSNAMSFAVSNPAPAIIELSPFWATPGGPAFTLTVNGTGFINGSVVRWNGSNRTTTYVSSTRLTAAIGAGDIAGAGTASVTVFNPAPGGGTSNTMSFVAGNPVPTISGVVPFWAAPGGPAFTLALNGTGFIPSSKMRWNGVDRTTTYVSSTRLTAAIAAGDIASEGTASITVFNPAPVGGTSNAASFLMGAPKEVFLPLVLRNSPSQPVLPGIPTLNPISNPGNGGNYAVTWTASAAANTYTLQESYDDPGFAIPTDVYHGASLTWSASDQAVGTYYYRVKARNAAGDSGWSATQSTTVGASGGWETIVSTDFEGAWPGSWVVSDDTGTDDGEYYWGKRNCQAFAGSYSGWGVGAGAQGSALSCGSNYPDNAASWMVYGPFDLSGTTAAELNFKLWLISEAGYDGLCRLASLDGQNFYGSCGSGNTEGWIDEGLDLADVDTLGSLLEEPAVWVAIVFSSDYGLSYPAGGYVDNIILRKCPSGATCPAGLSQTLAVDSQVTERPAHLVRPR